MNREISSKSFMPDHQPGSRIRKIRTANNMTQKAFAASLGIAQGFLCAIEKNKKKPSKTLTVAIINLYDINPDWLLHGEGAMYQQKNDSTLHFSAASGSIPLHSEPPNSIEKIMSPSTAAHITMPGIEAGCFAFKYDGDFMAPTIRDGDIVIIKPGTELATADIALIVGKWGDAFLRRYRRIEDTVFYSADNSSYSTFKQDSNMTILGRVCAVWRRIKT